MSCFNGQYTLPDINFVAGDPQELVYNIYSHSKDKPADLTGYTASFSVVPYLNQTGSPIITKTVEIGAAEGGVINNSIYFELTTADTLDLYGKYVYQLSIKDADGEIEPPQKGLMNIAINIDKDFADSQA